MLGVSWPVVVEASCWYAASDERKRYNGAVDEVVRALIKVGLLFMAACAAQSWHCDLMRKIDSHRCIAADCAGV
jgi:hypothetical protein